MKNPLSIIIIVAFVAVGVLVISNTRSQWHGNTFKWDQSGYQLHLPALLIYKDISKLDFYSYIDSVYLPSGEHTNYSIYPLENGNRINRYSVGPAVHQLPFFLIVHFINCTWMGYPQDGYSYPYEWSALLSNLFWVSVGLFVMRRFLLQYFSDKITTATLLAIGFGTNLYYYSAFNAGGTHGYTFFHCALMLVLTDRLYSKRSGHYFCYIAIVLGLIGITRPVDLLLVLIPLLWGVYNSTTLKAQVNFFKQNIGWILFASLCFIIALAPQLTLWKYVTGSWYYDGYANEGFILTEPRILKGLFSFQKGWLIYAPLFLFAIIGIYTMRYRFRNIIPVITIYLLLYVYVVFSWWNWWYGGSFGSRVMVDVTPLLCLPLASFIRYTAGRRTLISIPVYVVMAIFIFLNMFQGYQFFKGIIHPDRMTAKYYLRVFLKTTPYTEMDEKYLMSSKEYFGELNERYGKVNDK